MCETLSDIPKKGYANTVCFDMRKRQCVRVKRIEIKEGERELET